MKKGNSSTTAFGGWLLALFALFFAAAPVAAADDQPSGKPLAAKTGSSLEEDLLGEAAAPSIADPLEPLNRFFYHFNDRLYFWVLKPVASRYAKTVPADIRTTIVNFFDNLLAPVRIVNNLIQIKPRKAGIELSRFVINSTLGIAGLGDPARDGFHLKPQYADLGLSLGHYGVGGGIYFVWPFLGPSNLRDTIGFVGDSYLSPLGYLTMDDPPAGIGANAGNTVNRVSFRIGDYESFKESAFDPYTALRDAYEQHRRSMIEGKLEETSQPFFTEQRTPENRPAAHEEQQPAVAEKSMDDKYFVEVGSFIDLEAAQRLQEELRARHEQSIVWTHERGDYRFYGVQVPAGTEFA
ncbi:MAG: MlaA family lipoprotein, partial [Desulfobacteraceae bacterium]|nr:MlaA family lipoprotein [Desulfobacteraceae bacterium]